MAKKLLEKKTGDKYIGVFPLAFDDDTTEDGGTAIPTTIQIVPIGQWEHELYGPIIITPTDINEFVFNFNAGVRKGVYITAGHEGFEELPAQGWIKSVEARADGLWGEVEWNELGVETLSDKQFKFFSPEFCRDYEDPQTHKLFRNVLCGGALTKSPYFKELQAIVFSDKKLTSKFNDNTTMDLKTIVTKKVEELSAEEKAFLVEHKAELTPEQATAFTAVIDVTDEGADDAGAAAADATAGAAAATATDAAATATDAGQVNASEKGNVTISASELAILRAAADQGKQAFAQLEAQRLDNGVATLLFSETNKAGKFLPKSKTELRAFMATLNKEQTAKFSALLAQLPKTEIFNEVGADGATDATAQGEVNAKVDAKMKANPKMKYSDALKEVMLENKGLEERYDGELPAQKGKKISA